MTVPRGLLAGPIYLDHNATTPIDPAVTESMLPYLTAEFGNPSSTHRYGRESRIALDYARDQAGCSTSGRHPRCCLSRGSAPTCAGGG